MKNKNTNLIVSNIMKVAVSNLVIVLAGVINGFLIPKMMLVTEYGFYKIFTLYATYITLLHLGFIDGILIIFGGKKISDLDRISFRTYTKFLLLLEGSISIVVMCISLTLDGYYRFIFFMLSLNIIFANIGLYFQYISQATERFEELSFRNIIRSTLNILSAFFLFLFFHYKKIYISSYLYIYIVVIINFILATWYSYTYRGFIIGKSNSLYKEKDNIKNIFLEGIPYTIASFLASFILTIDRQFVSIFFNTEIYAVYAFAYNMLALITTAISAISTVLYPYLKKSNVKMEKSLPLIRNIISSLVSLMLCSYFLLIYIITWILPKYTESLRIFYIILPGLVFSSVISILLVNYYKVLFKQSVYMLISLVTVLLSIVANIIAYNVFGTPESISWASSIVMLIWYIISNGYFYIKYKIGFCTNLIYCLVIAVGFYIIASKFNSFLGLLFYLILYMVSTLILNSKEIKKLK